MTIHSAKGLEFKHVYIVGLEDTLFPSPMSSGSAKELEEERRLFYVAVTRAEKQVTLSYALNRYKWGNLERSNPSRFLKEMDQKFLNYPQTGGKPYQNNKPQGTHNLKEPQPLIPSNNTANHIKLKPIVRSEQEKPTAFVPSDPGVFAAGDSVQHERFGRGTIVSIEGQAPNTTVTVEFEVEGMKKLLLRFAKLRKA
jgi:DNA helicase-2/ATP-dependent DNA helicase PcrA